MQSIGIASEEKIALKTNPRRGRARVGLILPALNKTTEPEFAWIAPPGVSIHSARVPMRVTTREDLRAMNAEVSGAVALLAPLEPDVMTYACTAGTFLDGLEGLDVLVRTLSAGGRWPVVTTAGAMVEALRHLDVGRVALASPYPQDITEDEVRFLGDAGFDVVQCAWLGRSGDAIGATAFHEIAQLARDADHTRAEALFISCTDLRALEVAGALEERLGKPVLTSNQVTFWGVLRALGIADRPDGLGTLLSP